MLQDTRTRGLLLLTLALTVSCAVTPAGYAPVTDSDRTAIQTDVVTGRDIPLAGGTSVFDGLRLLRPTFAVGPRRTTLRDPSGTVPVVYLDGTRVGDVEILRAMHHSELATMRYLDPPAATIRYGTGHTAGAILVVTHPGR